MNLGLLFAFGAAVGVLSGMLGIGGGVVLVPGLILLFGFTQAEAQGTSLAVLIPPIGIFAAIVYYQHGYVRLPVVGMIAVGFMLGALLGAKLVPFLPIPYLRTGFGLLMLYLGFMFVLSSRGTAGAAWPAAVASLISWLGAIVLRRQRADRGKLPPPTADHDYHI